MKKCVLIGFVIGLIFINAFAEDIQFLTHSSAEQTFIDAYGELRGKEKAGKRAFQVELVREMMLRMKYPAIIKDYPLSRALRMVQTENNVALFNLSKTPERADTVKWVGPIQSETGYLYESKKYPTGIKTLEDAKKVKSICVLRGSVHETALIKNNFTNLHPMNNYEACFKMLQIGRVQLTPSATSSISEKLKQVEIPLKEIRQTPVVVTHSVGYIAFSKNIPDSVVKKWQEVFDQIKKSGKFKQLQDKYDDGNE